MMRFTLPRFLEIMTPARLCMADWRNKSGDYFETVRPMLVKAVGEISGSYPAEDCHEIRYSIDPHDHRYAGTVIGEHELLYEHRWFTAEDLQIWVLDPAKVAAFLGPASAPHVADKPIVKVVRDFDVIILPGGRSISFGRKYKRRAFLREVAKYCREHDTDLIHAQTIIADYNASLKEGDDSPKAIRTSDVVYDLFKGQSNVFKELFNIRDLSAGLFQLKVVFDTV